MRSEPVSGKERSGAAAMTSSGARPSFLATSQSVSPAAGKKTVTVLGPEALEVDPGRLGLEGSPTRVAETSVFVPGKRCVMCQDPSPEGAAAFLRKVLTDRLPEQGEGGDNGS